MVNVMNRTSNYLLEVIKSYLKFTHGDKFEEYMIDEEIKSMRLLRELREQSLYPIEYDGKVYEEEDCDEVFVSFYHSKESLSFDKSVFMFNNVWIYPDGSLITKD